MATHDLSQGMELAPCVRNVKSLAKRRMTTTYENYMATEQQELDDVLHNAASHDAAVAGQFAELSAASVNDAKWQRQYNDLVACADVSRRMVDRHDA
jgi:hypothetical protein